MPRNAPLSFSAGMGAGLALAALFAIGGQALADRSDDPYAPLDRFARIYSDIERHYVDVVEPDDLITAAIEGMVDELDPHSRWLEADDYRALQQETEGQYEGIGVEVRVVSAGVRIVRILPGGPAARTPLKRGDVVVSVDGHALTGLDLDEVSRHLKGPRGSSLTLQVRREGSEALLEIQTLRDRIDLEPVQSGIIDGGLAYVRLVSFQDGSATAVQRAVREARREGGGKALILDLRDNPGGLLDEAVELVDLFIDEGPIVSTRGRTEGEHIHTATRGGFPSDYPVAVLVNGSSASASEVVVGALQDLDRATIIGTHTYGKGSVQTLFHRGRGGLKLTIARYYTPAGTPVAPQQGRQPDIVVPYPTTLGPRAALLARVQAMPEGSDRADLLELVEDIPEDPDTDPVILWDEPLATRIEGDPQLRAAIQALASR